VIPYQVNQVLAPYRNWSVVSHILRHRISASASAVSKLKRVCLSVKMHSVYRIECWKWHFECLFDTFECDLIKALKRSVVITLKSVVFTLKQTLWSVVMTLAEALFLCRNKCRNDNPLFTVHCLELASFSSFIRHVYSYQKYLGCSHFLKW
jgi:hypothetical protein